MGVSRVTINLSWRVPRGGGPLPEDFSAALTTSAEEPIEAVHVNEGAWATSRVNFLPVFLEDYGDHEEPTEAFASGVAQRLASIAGFLDRQSQATFTRFRERGLKIWVFAEVRMDQDQMELDLPARFLSSCGRLGLDIALISNDISAAEAVALGWV